MLYPQSRLMVFCKAPESGKVKTRLSGYFEKHGMDGNQISAKLHEHLALHCLGKITKNNVSPVQLWCAPDMSHPFFNQCENDFNVELKQQVQGDLGKRMSHAFENVLLEHDSAVVIGTDCPNLDSNIVEQAFSSLKSGKDSVINPAEDGGYVLLGMTRAQPDVFKDISWGDSQVYTETLKKLTGDVQELPDLWDVDRPDDLQRLLRDANLLGLDDKFSDFLKSVV